MNPPPPDVEQLRTAVGAYLRVAYPDAPAPAHVLARVHFLDALAPRDAAPLGAFQSEAGACGSRYVLRLGQARYPHMKLVLEPAPDRSRFLFRADAHDQHLHAPAGSADEAQLRSLRKMNQAIIEDVERKWAEAGIPTFRSFLRQQVAARRR